MHREKREQGVAMVLVIIMGVGLMVMSMVSLDTTLATSETQESQHEVFVVKQIADSAAAQALARLKEGGFLAPVSGGGVDPVWVNFGDGSFLYYTEYDNVNEVNVIRAWGRVAADPNPISCTLAPDETGFDSTGWMLRGIEITIKNTQFIPEAPLFFGNGGIEQPEGGFDWSGGSDLTDPSTWAVVPAGSESSDQAPTVPFVSSALDHPFDYNYNGGTPTPATSNPHPYTIWGSQNPIGQFNIEAWFANSAGAGNDPTIGLTPPPTASFYDVSDNTSPDYPYPVDPDVPDVQTFAHALWSKFKDDGSTNKLSEGTHNGDYGDLSTPAVTFVTGQLHVAAGETFRGTGVLVIRDDFDPNVDTDNLPAIRARLSVEGNFEWTGLVVIAGWAPSINIQAGSDSTIVGALFGEDSVQSGGEISLDSATINLNVADDFRVLYSNALFTPGGLVNGMLPAVNREVVGVRKL